MTHTVKINSHIQIGGNSPVVVQSMTNTDTADIDKTYKQIKDLFLAGSELVRVTVNNEDSAKAIPYIQEKLLQENLEVPIVGDFHYNGHTLLKNHPACAEILAKYRINPGNVGFGKKKDEQFSKIIETAIKYKKPVRIGVNWGSLDQDLLANLMDNNAKSKSPKSSEEIMEKALFTSALTSAKLANYIGLEKDRIILSCKVSKSQPLIRIYQELSKKCDYPLHLGLTEAGMGIKGVVSSAASLAILLQQKIGDTIRVSLTPKPGGDRTEEVRVAREILQSLNIRSFTPEVTSCPGCGRTTSEYFLKLAENIENFLHEKMKIWQNQYQGVENLNVAVMGCIVNGPGESKHANIGISLPGTGESPSAPVFIDGKKELTLRGDNIAEEFKTIVENYVIERFK